MQMKVTLLAGALLGIGLEAHAAVPEFHGKWRGECKVRHTDGKESTKPSRLKIVQYGELELKINRAHYKTGEKNIVKSNLLGAGRILIVIGCQFLTAEQASGLSGPFPENSLGGFACSTESKVGIRGLNQNVEDSSVMVLVLDASGTLTRVVGQSETAEICQYQRE